MVFRWIQAHVAGECSRVDAFSEGAWGGELFREELATLRIHPEKTKRRSKSQTKFLAALAPLRGNTSPPWSLGGKYLAALEPSGEYLAALTPFRGK